MHYQSINTVDTKVVAKQHNPAVGHILILQRLRLEFRLLFIIFQFYRDTIYILYVRSVLASRWRCADGVSGFRCAVTKKKHELAALSVFTFPEFRDNITHNTWQSSRFT